MIRSCKITSKERVQPGLSLTPSEIEHLTARGQAAAVGSLESAMYFDPVNIDKNDIPVQYRRGVDLNTVWRASRNASKKITEAYTRANLPKSERSDL